MVEVVICLGSTKFTFEKTMVVRYCSKFLVRRGFKAVTYVSTYRNGLCSLYYQLYLLCLCVILIEWTIHKRWLCCPALNLESVFYSTLSLRCEYEHPEYLCSFTSSVDHKKIYWVSLVNWLEGALLSPASWTCILHDTMSEILSAFCGPFLKKAKHCL